MGDSIGFSSSHLSNGDGAESGSDKARDPMAELEDVLDRCVEMMCTNEGRKSTEEIHSGMDEAMGKFCDAARALDVAILRKRLILSRQFPEFIVKEEINEMKQEIARKEALIQRFHEKSPMWTQSLHSGPFQNQASMMIPNTSATGLSSQGMPHHPPPPFMTRPRLMNPQIPHGNIRPQMM